MPYASALFQNIMSTILSLSIYRSIYLFIGLEWIEYPSLLYFHIQIAIMQPVCDLNSN